MIRIVLLWNIEKPRAAPSLNPGLFEEVEKGKETLNNSLGRIIYIVACHLIRQEEGSSQLRPL